jgi:hypothetical protein
LNKRFLTIVTTVALISLLTVTTVLAATIDPVNHTVSTGNFFIDWSETNPEEIVSIQWNGSSNLTNSASNPNCPGNLEFFGNSWVSENEGTPSFFFGSLVGWGTTGTWSSPNSKKVQVDSVSSGCPGSANIPVTTKYQFFDHGPAANRIKIQRRFSFGSTPYPHDVRPYIPRLSLALGFTQVLHPDASGSSLLTETLTGCDFGCTVTDWNNSWFAMHNPDTGMGVIVRRASTTPAMLWVDQDGASSTNSTSVLLLQPPGGFTGNVVENEFLCFYDSSLWTPSTTLPAGC